MKKIVKVFVAVWVIALIVTSFLTPIKSLINKTFDLLDTGNSSVFMGQEIDNSFDYVDNLLGNMGRSDILR